MVYERPDAIFRADDSGYWGWRGSRGGGEEEYWAIVEINL